MVLDPTTGIGLLAGFLSGSLPFGYLAGQLRGIDIRQHGSGNIGATNAIRVLGKGIGIPVFALDVLKGLLPCLAIQHLLAEQGASPSQISLAGVLTGMAAILGHMFTPWLGFKGGKGVATAAGVLAGIAPVPMAVGLAAWLVFFFATRFVSLASIISGVAVAATLAASMALRQEWNPVLLGFGILLAALVTLRHRSNIKRLLAGTEPRAGRKKVHPQDQDHAGEETGV